MRILLTGDYDRDESASAIADMTEAAHVLRVGCLKAAAQSLANGEPVDLIVVAQTRPGQFSLSEIDALRQAAPLSPIVALLGSWCEGEMRSGSPWPGVTRVYWHQWRERFGEELAKLSRGEPSAWTQPLTATTEERLLSAKRDHHTVSGLSAVISDDYEMAEWLAAACRSRGMSVVKLQRMPCDQIDGVAVVIWNIGLFNQVVIEEVRTGALRFPRSPIIVLADFARPRDVERLSDAGAAAILSKPLMLNDLYVCLDRLVAVN